MNIYDGELAEFYFVNQQGTNKWKKKHKKH